MGKKNNREREKKMNILIAKIYLIRLCFRSRHPVPCNVIPCICPEIFLSHPLTSIHRFSSMRKQNKNHKRKSSLVEKKNLNSFTWAISMNEDRKLQSKLWDGGIYANMVWMDFCFHRQWNPESTVQKVIRRILHFVRRRKRKKRKNFLAIFMLY